MKINKSDLDYLDERINVLLPPRYHHCYGSVSPHSMGSATLVFDPDGRVAWDRIWTTFCDLGLAGGPPHRGQLLEETLSTANEADAQKRRTVAEEIQRGIRLTTGLIAKPFSSNPWICVECDSEAEATWLQFAIVAENVSARREEKCLLLPVGEHFRDTKEIKNIVVALAKSWHYWSGHLTGSQKRAFQDGEIVEPAGREWFLSHLSHGEEYAKVRSGLIEEIRNQVDWPIDSHRYFGWLGIECPDPMVAGWLMRAIVIEGIQVRREEMMLWLPVSFVAEGETLSKVGRVFGRALKLWQFASCEQRRS